jgi:hypothetical protein
MNHERPTNRATAFDTSVGPAQQAAEADGRFAAAA